MARQSDAKQVVIVVTQAQHEAIKKHVAHTGQSISDFVRGLIETQVGVDMSQLDSKKNMLGVQYQAWKADGNTESYMWWLKNVKLQD